MQVQLKEVQEEFNRKTDNLREIGQQATLLFREEHKTSVALGHTLKKAKEMCAEYGFPFSGFVKKYVRKANGEVPAMNTIEYHINISTPEGKKYEKDRNNQFRRNERKKAELTNALLDEGVVRYKGDSNTYELAPKMTVMINAVKKDDNGFKLLSYAWNKAKPDARERFLKEVVRK